MSEFKLQSVNFDDELRIDDEESDEVDSEDEDSDDEDDG